MVDKKCTLTNGKCGFQSCVGNNPGMCGINFEGPGTCSDQSKKCWFDKDCGSGETCTGDHINQTCASLLNTFTNDVQCNKGYEASVSSDLNYNGRINPQDITKRQPCGFVCNKSPPPSPPSPSKGMSTAAKVALGIAIASLVAVLVFLGYEALSKKKSRR